MGAQGRRLNKLSNQVNQLKVLYYFKSSLSTIILIPTYLITFLLPQRNVDTQGVFRSSRQAPKATYLTVQGAKVAAEGFF